METTEALAMAADNPHFPAWLRAACKDGAAEIDRRFGIGGELIIVRRERDEMRAVLLECQRHLACNAVNDDLVALYERVRAVVGEA